MAASRPLRGMGRATIAAAETCLVEHTGALDLVDLSWQDYEREVHDELKSKYLGATIQRDVRLPGALSGVSRQIDVLVTEQIQAPKIRTAVDAKHRARPIEVKQVESFIGLLRDVGVERGLMISVNGYTQAAYARAFRDDVDVDLDIFSLAEFGAWQAAGAIPYAGRTGVVMPAPVGWVVEIGPFDTALARLYRRGLAFETAYRAGEWMYVNIWNREDAVHNLDLLLQKQEQDILENFPDARISVRDFAQRSDARTCLRRAEIESYPSAELTAFAEFEQGILYVVLFSPIYVERRNLRKLEYIVQEAKPLGIEMGSN
jgi:Restriction endonuclease